MFYSIKINDTWHYLKIMQEKQTLPTVLYIEDDPASKKLLHALLFAHSNINLITAWSAEEGIKLADELVPELIFLDINLPCMCGREAVRHLQNNPKLDNTRIIALSADVIPENIDSALNLGFNGYITKPIKLNDIIDEINKLF